MQTPSFMTQSLALHAYHGACQERIEQGSAEPRSFLPFRDLPEKEQEVFEASAIAVIQEYWPIVSKPSLN